LIHTHLHGESLTKDDLTDLSLLSLDAVAAITINEVGRPDQVYWAHLLPANQNQTLWETLPPVKIHDLNVSFDELIRSLESEFAKGGKTAKKKTSFHDRAIVVHVDSGKRASKWDLEEILELCHSAEVEVVEVFTQRKRKPDPRYAIGRGKLDDLVLHSMQLEVDLLIFSTDLTPNQSRGLTDACELKVLDRTQLILDIFAQRAESRDGKLQVELAQLQYMLPRLIQKNTGMSRLTGGIGGRGPGETKLEINRRRAQDRIRWLKKQLSSLSKKRNVQRQRRSRSNIPIVSIVGYTNAGKSTLLNTLTRSEVIAENKLFATLDTSTRRLRFPQEQEVIITDTVGFIRDLPPSLVAAFKATLEELEHADLLLHVADASNPNIETQIDSVERIVNELGLSDIPSVVVLNKKDLADKEETHNLCQTLNGVAISALKAEETRDLIVRIHEELYRLDLLHRPENVEEFYSADMPESEEETTPEVPSNAA